MPIFLDASDYTIIKQETLGEHTLISCSALMEKDGERSTERHFVLCVKDGMIDGIVYGSRLTRLTYGNDPETVYSLDEIVLDADIPASVPTYFDDIEYTNTKDICDYVVWGVYEVTFDFGLETTSEEWECHSGFVNADNADLFCELLDFETFYYDVPHGFF